ncbi:MAG: translation initiation factor IF-3 [Candidatus Glassbacteria bacterium]
MRVNRQIKISPVRLIDEDGSQVGITPIEEALRIAEERGLDLVEIAPSANPPVCRIMDYGKFKYEESKKAKKALKKQHLIQVKEIKLRPKTEEHDFQFKLRHAKKFLEERHKVKFTLIFRGRELQHKDRGELLLEKVVEEIKEVGFVENGPKLEGKNMIMIVSPKH